MSTNARDTDPITSIMAGVEVEQAGIASRQRVEALRLVREYPGRTSAELGKLGNLDRYQLARRLPELRLSGAVENGDIRACRVNGRPSMTWWAT